VETPCRKAQAAFRNFHVRAINDAGTAMPGEQHSHPTCEAVASGIIKVTLGGPIH